MVGENNETIRKKKHFLIYRLLLSSKVNNKLFVKFLIITDSLSCKTVSLKYRKDNNHIKKRLRQS